MAVKKGGAPSLSYEEVKYLFEEKGCALISETYENNRKKLKYICICGQVSETSLKSFRQSGRCRECYVESLRLDLVKVKKIFAEAGCELLAEEYKNNQTPLKYRCSCGSESSISLANFQNGSRCYSCGIEKQVAKSRHTLEYIKQFFKENGCELLEGEYINSHQKLKYVCECGEISYTTFHTFRRGGRCRACGLRKQGESTRGEKHPNWNPDLSDEERKDKRLYREYREWRKKVYERDGYACMKCGDSSGGNLNAHHIYAYATHKELRTELSNGATLCVECHKEYHRIYGIENAVEEDFREFIGEERVDEIKQESLVF